MSVHAQSRFTIPRDPYGTHSFKGHIAQAAHQMYNRGDMIYYLIIALLLGNVNAIRIKSHSKDPDEDKALAAIGAAISAET